MNGQERFMASLRREIPDRVPIFEIKIDEPTLSAFGSATAEDFVEDMDLDSICVFENVPHRIIGDEEADELLRRAGLTISTKNSIRENDWGVISGVTETGLGYPITGPLLTPEDLKHYKPPDPHADYRYTNLRSAVRRYKGERAIVFVVHDAFEYSHYLLGGLDRLFLTYVDNPGAAHAVAEIVMDYKLAVSRKAIELGADAVLGGDDYAGHNGPLMSPAMFHEFVFPYLHKSVEAAHDLGAPYVKHSDGNIWPLMEMIVEAGIDAINPMEPLAGMDIGRMKRQFGDRVALVGNIDCSALLPFGSVDQVEDAVKETIAKAGKNGGLVIASSNTIHPAVEPDNYKAMVAATRRWGEYPLDEAMVGEFEEVDYIRFWGGSGTAAQSQQ